jgi:hypothetical protein
MNGKITPLCLAVSGKIDGQEYDSICVVPKLDQQTISISVATANDGVIKVADVQFPHSEHTEHHFLETVRKVVFEKLMVLI